MLLLGGGGILLMLTARGRAGQDESQPAADRRHAGRRLRSSCSPSSSAPTRRRTRFRVGMFAAMMLGAIIILANSLLEFVMLKRHQADHSADTLGKKLQLAGAAAGCDRSDHPLDLHQLHCGPRGQR